MAGVARGVLVLPPTPICLARNGLLEAGSGDITTSRPPPPGGHTLQQAPLPLGMLLLILVSRGAAGWGEGCQKKW